MRRSNLFSKSALFSELSQPVRLKTKMLSSKGFGRRLAPALLQRPGCVPFSSRGSCLPQRF